LIAMKIGRPVDATAQLVGLLVGLAGMIAMTFVFLADLLPMYGGRGTAYLIVAPLVICSFVGWLVGAVYNAVTRLPTS